MAARSRTLQPPQLILANPAPASHSIHAHVQVMRAWQFIFLLFNLDIDARARMRISDGSLQIRCVHPFLHSNPHR